MSTNIRIFEYLNKMTLEYYSYSYSCHFPSRNIFRYSFVDFWTTEYIRIFVCKFLKIWIYLNIYSKLNFYIFLSIFNAKCKSRYILCIQKNQCKILFRGSMSEPLEIICICICSIFWVQIYSDICLLNMLHPNIFG